MIDRRYWRWRSPAALQIKATSVESSLAWLA
jgi:hypothetical protein